MPFKSGLLWQTLRLKMQHIGLTEANKIGDAGSPCMGTGYIHSAPLQIRAKNKGLIRRFPLNLAACFFANPIKDRLSDQWPLFRREWAMQSGCDPRGHQSGFNRKST